jgi:hemerythrin
MRLFHWSKSNAVFVPEIDDEHRAIYQAGADLQQAFDSGAPLVCVQEILGALITVTEEHFAHEERLMRRGHYESFSWHKQQHDTARRRIKEYASQIEAGDAEAGKALNEFLSKWLHDHMGLTDRMMGAFLRNQQRAHV